MIHNNFNKDDANVLFWTYIASLIVIIVVLVIALLRIKRGDIVIKIIERNSEVLLLALLAKLASPFPLFSLFHIYQLF